MRRERASAVSVLVRARNDEALIGRLRGLVVISEFMKRRLVANGIPAEKITVERPSASSLRTQVTSLKPKNLRPATCDPGSAGPAEPVDLLFVGQLIRGKGVQLLLRAMARMKSRRTLDIVGAGNLEGRLRALMRELAGRAPGRPPHKLGLRTPHPGALHTRAIQAVNLVRALLPR